eukprot:2024621-Amphidinium_carterae.1
MRANKSKEVSAPLNEVCFPRFLSNRAVLNSRSNINCRKHRQQMRKEPNGNSMANDLRSFLLVALGKYSPMFSSSSYDANHRPC